MTTNNNQNIDLVVIGSGLAGLNFVDTYLEKKKVVHVISPNFSKILKEDNQNNFKALPSQMGDQNIFIKNYFSCNKIKIEKSCKVLGSLNPGGLSNYWGLQMDNYINNDQKNLKNKNFRLLEKIFLKFLEKYKLLGSFNVGKKIVYYNEYKIPNFLKKLLSLKDPLFICKKPILGFLSKKIKKDESNTLDEKKQKLIAKNFFEKIKEKKNIKFHNFYVEKIKKHKNKIKIICMNNKKEHIIFAKKVVFATGTIATTKILLDFLNITRAVKIKHHPRLLSMFFSRKPIKSNLNFTPSLIQIINRSKKDYYSADLRPGNKLITSSIIEAFPFMGPLRFFINLIRARLIFSNILLDSSFSNIYLKKEKNNFKLFFKKNNLLKNLKERNFKIFKFLLSNKLIMPFYKTFYPGDGADYHYFGSIPFNNNGKLSVNNNCQLNFNKNIYIVDGSVFDFKTNKYPLGIVIANSRRIGKILSK
jgi:hypothetical protein